MKIKNNKKILISFLSLIIIGMLLVSVYIMDDRKMISVYETQTASTQPTITNSGGSIKIGLVGDSWVAGEKLDEAIETELNSSGINSDIISFGHPGAKSKAILNDLISDTSTNSYSSNSLLLDNNIKYIIVIAGVNDTASHIGSDFYNHHIIEIVKLINSYNKFPIILEVPEYGIEEPESFKSSLKHNLYKIIFDNNKTDIIKDYRTSLMNEIESSNLNYKIIPFEPVINDFYEQRNIYDNPFHLNEEGNFLLGTYIGNYMYKNIIN